LVKPWTEYTLYYRDPRTRSFKPIMSKEGYRYQVRFSVRKDKVYPKTLTQFRMRRSDGTNYDRMFSRKVETKSWILEDEL